MLTPAEIDGLPLHPPFRASLIGYLLEGLVAVFPEIVYDDVPRSFDAAHLPVGYVSHTFVHTADYHSHMLPWRGCQCEHRLILPVDHLYDEYVPQQAFHPVELDVVHPFAGGLLPGAVFLAQPVTLPKIIHPVVDIEVYMIVMGERQRQYVVAMYLLGLG